MSHVYVGADLYCERCGRLERHPMHVDPPAPAEPDPQAELPYAGTSGWSGSQTSEERAAQADGDGVTASRQREMLALLRASHSAGLTWKEADVALGWNHHGKTTGVLSVLHKAGLIARLSEVRDRCKVYVDLAWVGGRETEAQGREPTVAAVVSAGLVEHACEVMHDAHEAAAAGAGWEAQEASRKPWSEVPEANKATMRAAVTALLLDEQVRGSLRVR